MTVYLLGNGQSGSRNKIGQVTSLESTFSPLLIFKFFSAKFILNQEQIDHPHLHHFLVDRLVMHHLHYQQDIKLHASSKRNNGS